MKLSGILGVVAAFLGATPLAASTTPPAPKLIVAIAVDQFSAGLLAQYRTRFTGGLKRMLDQGVVFPNGYQSHAASETCPGHSTILTGRHPAATGIIGNGWYDRDAGTQVYCLLDPASPVPGRPNAPRGPGTLKVSTLGAWMKAANPASRSFAVSGKDRGAITMAGAGADGTFWWDEERGFNTYVPAGANEAARLAPVAGFNKALFAAWRKRAPAWVPADPRCKLGAGPHRYGNLPVDHAVPPPGWTAPPPGTDFSNDGDFKKWFRATPMYDQVALSLAGQLIDEARLGRGAAPDVLAVSLSATDYVGHRYGNAGPEMCDHLVHLDRMLGSFLTKLEALKIPVLVSLTADHGAVDAAERVAERGFPAVRLSGDALLGEVGAQVRADLKLDYNPLAGDPYQIFVVPFGEASPRLIERIVAATVAELRLRPEVAAVYTKAQALAAMPPRDRPADELTLLERIALSTDPVRSGDVMAVMQPYATFGEPTNLGDTIAGHGSPWDYDRRVPILFWWPGAEGFEQPLPVMTVDIAPTLASRLGIATPAVDGRCLDLDRTAATSCAK